MRIFINCPESVFLYDKQFFSARFLSDWACCAVRSIDSIRTEKGFVGFCFFDFFLCFVFRMLAHVAACLTAVLAEIAIRTGVFFEKDDFPHLLF